MVGEAMAMAMATSTSSIAYSATSCPLSSLMKLFSWFFITGQSPLTQFIETSERVPAYGFEKLLRNEFSLSRPSFSLKKVVIIALESGRTSSSHSAITCDSMNQPSNRSGARCSRGYTVIWRVVNRRTSNTRWNLRFRLGQEVTLGIPSKVLFDFLFQPAASASTQARAAIELILLKDLDGRRIVIDRRSHVNPTRPGRSSFC